MARGVRKKPVYRDVETGRLIPKKIADKRDPSTWVEEEFLVAVDRDGGSNEDIFETRENERNEPVTEA